MLVGPPKYRVITLIWLKVVAYLIELEMKGSGLPFSTGMKHLDIWNEMTYFEKTYTGKIHLDAHWTEWKDVPWRLGKWSTLVERGWNGEQKKWMRGVEWAPPLDWVNRLVLLFITPTRLGECMTRGSRVVKSIIPVTFIEVDLTLRKSQVWTLTGSTSWFYIHRLYICLDPYW